MGMKPTATIVTDAVCIDHTSREDQIEIAHSFSLSTSSMGGTRRSGKIVFGELSYSEWRIGPTYDHVDRRQRRIPL